MAQLKEIIIDGGPGAGKSKLIKTMSVDLQASCNEMLHSDVNILINGGKIEEGRDELVLAKPDEGEISFIQKRYDPEHCLKWANIQDVLNFYTVTKSDDKETRKWINETFPGEIVINLKERDGPSSSVIFNWTSYKDLVLGYSDKHNQESTKIRPWNLIAEETNLELLKWTKELSRDRVVKHFIYLQGTPNFLLKRVKQRNRQYEAGWFDINLSESLVDAYNFFYQAGCRRDLSKELPITWSTLYDSKLTTMKVFDAQSKNIEQDVLTYVKYLFKSSF